MRTVFNRDWSCHDDVILPYWVTQVRSGAACYKPFHHKPPLTPIFIMTSKGTDNNTKPTEQLFWIQPHPAVGYYIFDLYHKLMELCRRRMILLIFSLQEG